MFLRGDKIQWTEENQIYHNSCNKRCCHCEHWFICPKSCTALDLFDCNECSIKTN